jgi:hypothetical protein
MHRANLNRLTVRFLWAEAFLVLVPCLLICASRFVFELDSTNGNDVNIHSLSLVMAAIHIVVIDFYLMPLASLHQLIFRQSIFTGDGYILLYPSSAAEWLIFVFYGSALSAFVVLAPTLLRRIHRKYRSLP